MRLGEDFKKLDFWKALNFLFAVLLPKLFEGKCVRAQNVLPHLKQSHCLQVREHLRNWCRASTGAFGQKAWQISDRSVGDMSFVRDSDPTWQHGRPWAALESLPHQLNSLSVQKVQQYRRSEINSRSFRIVPQDRHVSMRSLLLWNQLHYESSNALGWPASIRNRRYLLSWPVGGESIVWNLAKLN